MKSVDGEMWTRNPCDGTGRDNHDSAIKNSRGGEAGRFMRRTAGSVGDVDMSAVCATRLLATIVSPMRVAIVGEHNPVDSIKPLVARRGQYELPVGERRQLTLGAAHSRSDKSVSLDRGARMITPTTPPNTTAAHIPTSLAGTSLVGKGIHSFGEQRISQQSDTPAIDARTCKRIIGMKQRHPTTIKNRLALLGVLVVSCLFFFVASEVQSQVMQQSAVYFSVCIPQKIDITGLLQPAGPISIARVEIIEDARIEKGQMIINRHRQQQPDWYFYRVSVVEAVYGNITAGDVFEVSLQIGQEFVNSNLNLTPKRGSLHYIAYVDVVRHIPPASVGTGRRVLPFYVDQLGGRSCE